MESLNGHEAGNGGHGQGNTYGNSPFLDPTGIARNGAMQSMARILMAEMARRLKAGTSGIELAIRRKSSPHFTIVCIMQDELVSNLLIPSSERRAKG